MITLSRKLKEERSSPQAHKKPVAESARRVSIRDKLLVKEVPEMESNLPGSCKINFEDVNNLDIFQVLVTPDEGFWKGGKFHFDVHVPDDYNIVPPKVTCTTRIWHPNITEDGKICLSLLREHSVDGTGWAPTRRLKDVIWGLNSLFTDLLNFDDPLNLDAAEHYLRDRKDFEAKVRFFVDKYAKR